MHGGLNLILASFRLHNDAPDRRLAALLKASRDAQAEVSTKLAAQVLGALHELLRGLHSADKGRIEALATSRPAHLYEGLLTVLLRLVFLLYAGDRLGRLHSANSRPAAKPRWRKALLSHPRRRADRQRLRNGDGVHGRDASRPGNRDPRRQERPDAGVCRRRGAESKEGNGARQ